MQLFVSSLLSIAPNYSFVHEATTASIFSHYDYIVVGGGTAGCALAATLSKKASVLVLERGGTPYGNSNITNIDPWIELMSDGSPGSPVQFFVSEDGVLNARPRVLGGGTSINAGFYSRAQTSFVKESKWDEKLVEESYQWVEKKVVFEPLVTGWTSAFKAGMLEAGVTPDNGFTYDHLVGSKVGGIIFDSQRHRHTAADLFEYATPKRITVLLRATVHKILFATIGENDNFECTNTLHVPRIADAIIGALVIPSCKCEIALG